MSADSPTTSGPVAPAEMTEVQSVCAAIEQLRVSLSGFHGDVMLVENVRAGEFDSVLLQAASLLRAKETENKTLRESGNAANEILDQVRRDWRSFKLAILAALGVTDAWSITVESQDRICERIARLRLAAVSPTPTPAAASFAGGEPVRQWSEALRGAFGAATTLTGTRPEAAEWRDKNTEALRAAINADLSALERRAAEAEQKAEAAEAFTKTYLAAIGDALDLTPLILTAYAENNEENYADILVRLLKKRLSQPVLAAAHPRAVAGDAETVDQKAIEGVVDVFARVEGEEIMVGRRTPFGAIGVCVNAVAVPLPLGQRVRVTKLEDRK